jgi:hypothetical protein
MIFGYAKNSHCNEIIFLDKQNHYTFQHDYHLKPRKQQTKRFSLYELILINHGCQSYELIFFNLILLMYADDTVVFSENVEDLQNIIDYS